MTGRHRQSSSESASYSSAATARTHRRKTPKKIPHNDDDDANASDSDYNEQQQNVQDSKSVSHAQTHVPETPSLFSASDFPNTKTCCCSCFSYVKIAPLPIFRGTAKESPMTHLSRFNKVCRANNASSVAMQMRIFPVTLEDEAALWYDLNVEPYYGSLSWEETKLSFLQAYYDAEPVDGLQSELAGIRQDEKDSVRSYFLRLQWILKRWPEHGLSEDLLRGVFMDGLREECRDWVLRQKPDSLNDALRLAFGFEQVRGVRGKKKEWSDDGVAEDLSSGQRRVEMDEGEKGSDGFLVGSVKKKQCQCSKHKCGKKKLFRNSSLESRISHCD